MSLLTKVECLGILSKLNSNKPAYWDLNVCRKQKLLGLQMVLGLRFCAGAAISGAGAAAPVAPALATGLDGAL